MSVFVPEQTMPPHLSRALLLALGTIAALTFACVLVGAQGLSSASAVLKVQACSKDGDCKSLLNTKCNASSGKCVCIDGFSEVSSYYCGKKIGDPCDGKCDAQNSRCEGEHTSRVCACEDGLTASRDGTFCYGIPLVYGDACDHVDNCTFLGSHMQCMKFRCQCEDRFVRTDDGCKEKIVDLNAKCDKDTQICFGVDDGDDVIKRQCMNGTCLCRDKFVAHNRSCKPKISLLGAPCNEAQDVCHLERDGELDRVICHEGICQCKDEFILHQGKCKRRISKLGEMCSPGSHICHLPSEGDYYQSDCINGTCQCKRSFINDFGICKRKISIIGAVCNPSTDMCYWDEDGDQQKVHCSNGVCDCKLPFLLIDKKCRKTADFSQSCSNDADCRDIANSKCNDAGYCQCKEDFSKMNDSACGKAHGDRCYDGHCDANNTFCRDNICICKLLHKVNYNNTFCYKQPTAYGDLCNATSDCPGEFGDGRVCGQGRCVCQDDFGFDREASRCKYKVDEIDKACNSNQVCWLERDGDNQHVQCIDGVCQCVGKLSKDKQSCSGAAAFVASISSLLLVITVKFLA